MTGSPASVSERQSVFRYVNVLLHRRRFIAGVGFASCLLVGVATLLTPRYYDGSARFLAQEPATSQASGISQLATQFGLVAGRASASSPQFYADLLQSREVLRTIVLTTYPLPDGSSGTLIAYFKIGESDHDEAVQWAIKRLRKWMDVDLDRATGVVHFTVSTKSRALSQQITERFLNLVNDYNLRRRQSQARAEREFAEQRRAEAERDLDAAEDSLVAFRRRNRHFAEAPDLAAQDNRLQRQVTLRQQLFMSLSQSYEAARLDEVRDTPVITVLEPPAGFVEPHPRGTIRNALVAMLVGLVLAVATALAGALSREAEETAPDHYREFRSLLHEAGADIRRLVLLRSARN